MSCCAGPVVADFAAPGNRAARGALLDELRASRRVLADGRANYVFSVPAIHCGTCIASIERAAAELEGVTSVRANLSLKRVALTLDTASRSLDAVVAALDRLGFEPQPLAAEDNGKGDPHLKLLVRSLAISGFATANIMLLSIPVWNGADGATRELFHFISALIAIPSVALGGLPFFRSAFAAIKHHRLNMDVPISLGVLLATGMSLFESLVGGGDAYFDAAVSLLFFLLIGRTLDYMMRSRARTAAEGLARLSSKGGHVVKEDGALHYLALDDIHPGMRIRVAAGERFPVDGAIIEGESDIDRSLVTGESQPQRAGVDTDVEAGTLNLTGAVDVVATRAAQELVSRRSDADDGSGRKWQIDLCADRRQACKNLCADSSCPCVWGIRRMDDVDIRRLAPVFNGRCFRTDHHMPLCLGSCGSGGSRGCCWPVVCSRGSDERRFCP